MTTTGIEFTHSGVSLKGDWEEICSFAKGFEKVIEKAEVSDKTINRYNSWRPRRDDSKEDIKNKTVEVARLDVSELEKNGLAKKAYEFADRDDTGKIKTATSKAVKDLYLGSAKYFSKMEKIIYGNMMLKLNPYFFDDAGFSANLYVKNKADCQLKFNFTDTLIRDKVKTLIKG